MVFRSLLALIIGLTVFAPNVLAQKYSPYDRFVQVRVIMENGQPVAQADVDVDVYGGSYWFGKTDQDGMVVARVPEKLYNEEIWIWVFITKFTDEGLEMINGTKMVYTGQSRIEIKLSSPGPITLRGKVIFPKGEKTGEVLIYVRSSDNSLTRTKFSDRKGRYQIKGLRPGSYSISVVGYGEQVYEIFLSGKKTKEKLNIRLGPCNH